MLYIPPKQGSPLSPGPSRWPENEPQLSICRVMLGDWSLTSDHGTAQFWGFEIRLWLSMHILLTVNTWDICANSSAVSHTRLSGQHLVLSSSWFLWTFLLGTRIILNQAQKELSNSTSQLNSWLSLGDREGTGYSDQCIDSDCGRVFD